MTNNKYITKEHIIRVLLLLLMAILMQTGGAYLQDAITGLISIPEDITEAYNEGYNALTSMSSGMIIYVCLVAPFIEEGVFRLLIISLGKKYLPFWIINIIQALAFGIYHGNLIQGTYAFVLGLLLGAIYRYMGGYLASAFVHAGINTAGLTMMSMLPNSYSPVVEFAIGIVCLAIVTLIVLIYYRADNINKKKSVIKG